MSSRFGRDKAVELFDGMALIDHMRALAAGRCSDVVVVGRAGGIADLPEPGLGPLGGMAGALRHAADRGYESVLTMPCDMPGLPATLLDDLIRRVPSYCSDAPVVGHWPAALAAPLLDHILVSERRSVQGWARSIGALPIASPVALVNINTPADLAAL